MSKIKLEPAQKGSLMAISDKSKKIPKIIVLEYKLKLNRGVTRLAHTKFVQLK